MMMDKKTMGLVAFSAVLALILYAVGELVPEWAYPQRFTLLLCLAGVFWISDRVAEAGGKIMSEPGKLMLSLTLRFLLSIVLAVVFVFFYKGDTRVFAVNFGGLYLSMLGFEIYSLLTNFRSASKNAGIDETDDHIKA